MKYVVATALLALLVLADSPPARGESLTSLLERTDTMRQLDKRRLVLRDRRGSRVGAAWVTLTGSLIIRDRRGRRVGTIKSPQ